MLPGRVEGVEEGEEPGSLPAHVGKECHEEEQTGEHAGRVAALEDDGEQQGHGPEDQKGEHGVEGHGEDIEILDELIDMGYQFINIGADVLAMNEYCSRIIDEFVKQCRKT